MIIKHKKYKLNKLLILGICFFLFSSLSCSRYKIKNIYSSGREIICFGNSITAGSGVLEREAYPFLLSELIGYPVINAGQSGDTSADGLRRLGKDILAHQPRLVIIEFGGNDFLRQIPLSITLENLRLIIERIQEAGAMVAVADISCGIFMRGYRAHYRELARNTHSIFIPALLEGLLTNPSFKSDNIHPNSEGHRLIAKKIIQIISPYLMQDN